VGPPLKPFFIEGFFVFESKKTYWGSKWGTKKDVF
jgi:hypothetical protein